MIQKHKLLNKQKLHCQQPMQKALSISYQRVYLALFCNDISCQSNISVKREQEDLDREVTSGNTSLIKCKLAEK